MADATVLLCTEGTYPFLGGGVSTWCDILCRELEEYDFTLYAVTGEPEVRLQYELPPNVRSVVHIPLFGTYEPAEFILASVPPRVLAARRRATTPAAVAAGFDGLLRRLLAAIGTRSGPDDDGRLLWELWSYFQEHDWRRTWKAESTWETFLQSARETADPEDAEPTIADVAGAMRLLSSYLVPLSAPVPRTDIVHTTIAGFPGIAGVVAAFEHGTPFLVTEHGVWVRERYIAVSSGPYSAFSKRFLMGLSGYLARVNYRVARVISPVTAFNRRWELPYGAPDKRIVPVPNGIDPGMFTPTPKPVATAGRPVVVAAARVIPLKDIETMIRSAVVVRAAIPDVLYLVYGSLDADVPYVERCRTLIAELGLQDSFVFAGHHAKPADLYNEGDISALSSISEGFPYTVLESMACARPVVATDVGGVREALDGYGILVPPRDHVAFGEAVVTLLRDNVLRTRLGRQAREAVLARFRTEHSVEGYRRFYADALA